MHNKIFAFIVTMFLASLCSPEEIINNIGGGVSGGGSGTGGGSESAPSVTLKSAAKDTVAAAGGSVVIEFDASEDWAVSVTVPAGDDGKWITVVGTNGTKNDHKVTVTLSANDSDKYRTMDLNIYSGTTKVSVAIAQRPKAADQGGTEGGDNGGQSGGDNQGGTEGGDNGGQSGGDNQGGQQQTGPLALSVDGTQYLPGPSYIYLTVVAKNETNDKVSAEIGVEYSQTEGMSDAKSLKAGDAKIDGNATYSTEVQLTGLAEKTATFFKVYAKIGDKTYKSEVFSRETESPFFYFPGDPEDVFSFGEEGGSFKKAIYANIAHDMTISADWVKVSEESHEYHDRYNFYTFAVAANETDKDRSATITFTNKDYGKSLSVTVNQSKKTPATGETAGHAWVNLGLPSGTLWATTNVGAAKPEEFGRYVAWGETVILGEEDKENARNYEHYQTYAKKNFSEYSYKFFYSDGKEFSNLSKYNSKDNILVLEEKDDAVVAQWGKEWTMPTYDQVKELVRNTHYQWTSNYNETGVAGGIFYRKKSSDSYSLSDAHIFIPAGGAYFWEKNDNIGDFGMIWSKSLVNPVAASHKYFDVWTLYFNSNGCDTKYSGGRDGGRTLRGVVAPAQ